MSPASRGPQSQTRSSPRRVSTSPETPHLSASMSNVQMRVRTQCTAIQSNGVMRLNY